MEAMGRRRESIVAGKMGNRIREAQEGEVRWNGIREAQKGEGR